MSIETLVLYGSRARGDYESSSDTDLLSITNDKKYKMVVANHVNLACYPSKLIFERAKKGDLFILHIIEEGKVIYDTNESFLKLKKCFNYKESYTKEIKKASDIGWLLLEISDTFKNPFFINKRIAWCVRTILIAKSAELRQPKFSAMDLDSKFPNANVYQLIKNKNNTEKNHKILQLFSDFLTEFGSRKHHYSDIHSHFENSNNAFGLKTLKIISSEIHDYI